MYTVIGGNPFVDFSGTVTFTGVRIVGKCSTFDEMEKIAKDYYHECAGLILVLFNGEEIEYENGKYKRPPGE